MTLFKKLHFHILLVFSLMILMSGCYKGKSVDIVIHNARIHTMNESDVIYEAIAIKEGKIVEVGPEQQILNKYTSKEEIDAGGKDIYPGFTDVHGHIIDLAKRKLSVDLTGTRSYDELLMRLEKYSQLNSSSFIIGRGLDTSLWSSKEKFTNERLNSVFSKIPVCLYFVGDEVVVVNKAFLTKLVQNGPDVWPGAKILERQNGQSITLRYLDRKSIVLEDGDIVHRHMMDGDAILFNRQPTLHRMSMMCHIAKIMKQGDTFRMNVADTKPYNADFDGDRHM